MSPVPSACQAIADEVTSLENAYTTLATQAQEMVGQPAWAALEQLGELRRQLTGKRNELARCIATHSAALTGSVVVINASGAPAPDTPTVTLWDLGSGGAVAREVAKVQAGAFGFQGPLPAQAAISVQTAGVVDVTGLDFRSGILQGPLAGQTPRIEIVLGPTLTIPAKWLTDWAATVQIPRQTISAISGPTLALDVTVRSASVSLAANVITITVNAEVSGVPQTIGQVLMSATISLALVAANAPHIADIVAVTFVGANPIQISATVGEPMLGLVTSALSPFIGSRVQDKLNRWANKALYDILVAGFALGSLPPATRISLRSIRIEEGGITFQPVLGLIGTALSSFRPSPLPLPQDD